MVFVLAFVVLDISLEAVCHRRRLFFSGGKRERRKKKKKPLVSATPCMLQRFCWLQHLRHDELLSFATRRPCVLQLRWSCKMCTLLLCVLVSYQRLQIVSTLSLDCLLALVCDWWCSTRLWKLTVACFLLVIVLMSDLAPSSGTRAKVCDMTSPWKRIARSSRSRSIDFALKLLIPD